MKRCIGCGAVLQDENPAVAGYVKRLDQDYCQRCFRLTHYGDLTIDMKHAIEPEILLEKIKTYQNVGIVFIIDVLHLTSSINKKIFAALTNYPMMIIINKLDLLPDNTNFSKLEAYFRKVLHSIAKNNDIRSVIMTHSKDTSFNALFMEDINHLNKKACLFVGLANAGKSTIINKLSSVNKLTTSYYPGTTLDFNSFDVDGKNFIDTPGLVDDGSIIMHLNKDDLQLIVPKVTIRPLVYQLYSKQSFFIEGIMRLDIETLDHGSVVFYLDPGIKIHRCKYEKADEYQNKHPELFNRGYHLSSHSFESLDGFELAINGLGMIGFSKIIKAQLQMIEGVEIIKRKRLL